MIRWLIPEHGVLGEREGVSKRMEVDSIECSYVPNSVRRVLHQWDGEQAGGRWFSRMGD